MKKILIVDDSLFMRSVLKDILSKLNDEHQIIEAGSGATALEIFKKEKPDLILLDIIMPGGEEEGIQVLQKIMKNNSKIKIIMISAVGQDLIVQKCKRLGAKDFIMKPFDKEQIVKTAEKWLNMN